METREQQSLVISSDTPRSGLPVKSRITPLFSSCLGPRPVREATVDEAPCVLQELNPTRGCSWVRASLLVCLSICFHPVSPLLIEFEKHTPSVISP